MDHHRSPVIRAWWNEIACRRLVDVLDGRPAIIVAGSAYIDAIADELDSIEPAGGAVVILSAKAAHPLALRYDARISPLVGAGTLGTLNASAFRWFAERVADHCFEHNEMQGMLDHAAGSVVPVEKTRRVRSDDSALLSEIRALRLATPDIARTSALRVLRCRGRACSQERFARLWLAADADDAADLG